MMSENFKKMAFAATDLVEELYAQYGERRIPERVRELIEGLEVHARAVIAEQDQLRKREEERVRQLLEEQAQFLNPLDVN